MTPASRQPLPLQEKEYRLSLFRLERRAIIPLKAVVLVVTIILWTWLTHKTPSPAVFALFFSYLLFTLMGAYFFYLRPLTLNQIRPLTLISYLVDLIFVSMLIYFDLTTAFFGPVQHHDFYLLYFLLVMRGFALFKTLTETIFVNLLMSLLYILTFYLTRFNFSFLFDANFFVSLVLVWLVILMTWFIVMIITKQKMELLEVHDRLLRTDNLVRVGELAAGVAHEINNPIGIIATTAEYLMKMTPPDDARIEDLQAIHTEAMRCRDIVQEMLTYARPRSVGVSAIEARMLNDEVLNFVFPSRRPGRFVVDRQYQDEVPVFEADPNLIKQALLNIYINAKQAVPDGKPGRIVTRIGPAARGRRMRIEIEDNGVGIPEQDIDHIFEPFFTRKPEGTGLGLAVTQRIVEMFNGSISVRPASPHGTVFVLEFPAAKS